MSSDSQDFVCVFWDAAHGFGIARHPGSRRHGWTSISSLQHCHRWNWGPLSWSKNSSQDWRKNWGLVRAVGRRRNIWAPAAESPMQICWCHGSGRAGKAIL